MSSKDSSNSQDSASTPTLSKKSITLLLGLLLERLRNLERKQKSEQLFRMLIAIIMVAQFIVLAILGTVVYQIQKKTFTSTMVPNIRGVKLEVPKVNGKIDLANIVM